MKKHDLLRNSNWDLIYYTIENFILAHFSWPFVSTYCTIFVLSTFFFNSDVNKFFLSVLFCPCGTKCSIKLTTVE